MWWKWRPEREDDAPQGLGHAEASEATTSTDQALGDTQSELSKSHNSSAETLRKLTQNPVKQETKSDTKPPEPALETAQEPPKSTWWRWSSTSSANPVGKPAGAPEPTGASRPDTDPTSEPTAPASDKSEQPKSYGWFLGSTKRQGELAVAGTPTESQPKPANPQSSDTQIPKRLPESATVVPSFANSFPPVSVLGRLWAKHPYRVAPPRVKKAVVIGIHGYFPARISRTILGEPTGTSLKFATEGAAILEQWAKDHNKTIQIEKIALEGEGRIAQREEALFELLKNWLDTLKQADFIFFAVHSQGAVVGVHIIARLIEECRLKARIGLLTMAGVCLGPMQGMDQNLVMKAISTIEHASLLELFELQNPDSVQSKKFASDLSSVLQHGVKFVCVASADDQLVPLYSALCIHADHPNIFRAVYLENPQVLAPLLELAARRRNEGLDDFGTLKEISSSLAGALTGGGHSRLYSSDKVYRLALDTILESSYTTGVPPKFHDFVPPRKNPYVLPWSLHALVSEPPEHLRPVVGRLYREYSQWKPDTKALKELRYRLGALKNVSAKL